SAYALIREHSPPKVVVNVFGPDATIETGPSQPPIPDGVVPFNQLVNVTAMGIAILVTVQNDNDDYVDADISIVMFAAFDAGGIEPVETCHGVIRTDPPSEEDLRRSGPLWGPDDYNQNIEGTGSRFLLTPFLDGRFTITVRL